MGTEMEKSDKFSFDKMEKLGKYINYSIPFFVIFTLFMPFLLTRKSFGLFDFTKTGSIGDTIGGITAPIIGIFGALLVYRSLMAQVRANRKIMEFNERVEEFNRLAVDQTELENIKALIKDTIEDFEKFSYSTSYGIASNSIVDRTRKVSGKSAFKDFITTMSEVLKNNVDSGRSLKKGSLNNVFKDEVSSNMNDLFFIINTIINTIKTIWDSNVFKKKNPYCIYIYFKLVRYLNEYLIRYSCKVNQIVDILPQNIRLCETDHKDGIDELEELLAHMRNFQKEISGLQSLIES